MKAATKRRLTVACGGLLIIATIVAAVAISSIATLTNGGEQRVPTVKWMYRTADGITYSPVITDLNKDNKSEILVVDYGLVYCLDGTGGAKWIDLIHYISTGIAVADVDGDGEPEVIVARQIWGLSTSDLFCLNPTGTLKWNTTVHAHLEGNPTVADLNGDNRSEILIGSWSYSNSSGIIYPATLLCFNCSGELEWYSPSSTSLYRACVSDIDGDAKLEVIVSAGSTIRCLNASGQMKWDKTFSSISCAPVVTDVDETGKPEILVGAGGVYCLNGSGAEMWNYPTAYPVSHIGVANVTNDKKTNIMAAAGNEVYCLNGLGVLEWVINIGNGTAYGLAVSDVDKDGKQEVVVGTLSEYSEGSRQPGGVICCLNSTGGLKWSYSTGAEDISSVIVADVDGDALPEIIAAAWWDHMVYCLSAFPSREGAITLTSMPFVLAGLVIAGVAATVVSSLRKEQVAPQRRT